MSELQISFQPEVHHSGKKGWRGSIMRGSGSGGVLWTRMRGGEFSEEYWRVEWCTSDFNQYNHVRKMITFLLEDNFNGNRLKKRISLTFSSYFSRVMVLAPSSISCTALAKLLRKSDTSRDRIANNRSASMTSFSVGPTKLSLLATAKRSLLAMGSSVCVCMSTWRKAPSQENGSSLTTNRYPQHHHRHRKVQNQYQSHNVLHHWAAPSTHRPVC